MSDSVLISEQESVSAASDDALLQSLEDKLTLVRDRVKSVALGYQAGMYLFGSPGVSKTYSVEMTLKSLNVPYKLTNSKLTARGLVDLLQANPEDVHVLDDCEQLFSEKSAFGVLRSALWGQSSNGRMVRTITWQTNRARIEVEFWGGVVMIGNVPLADVPELAAVKTRIPVVEYRPLDGEVAALMRKICRAGHQHGQHRLEPDECLEVCNLIILRSKELKRPLDLRLLVNAFADRIQAERGEADTSWRDLLESRLRQRVLAPGEARGVRAEKKDAALAVARRIKDLPTAERLAEWKKAGCGSQATLYRVLAALSQQDEEGTKKGGEPGQPLAEQ